MSDRETSPTDGHQASHDPATFGQRPVAGARGSEHAATTFTGGFGGGAEATDFLGLSQEIGGIDSAGFHPTPTGPTGVVGGRTHPGEYPTEPQNSASWLLQSERIVGEDRPQPEGEESEQAAEESHGRKRSFSFVLKFAAALLVGAGATFGYWTFKNRQAAEADQTPTVAHAPVTKPFVPAKLPDPMTSQPAGSAYVPTGTSNPEPEPAEPRIGQQRFEEWLAKQGGFPFLLGFAANSPNPSRPPADTYAADPPSPDLAAADPVANTTSTPEPSRTLRLGTPVDATPARAPLGGLRLATPEELAGIWPGDTVPMDALGAETRLLTPAVGLVHVIMKTGEIFDGRLYAIGAGQVWLEATIGRLALDGNRVKEITVVTTEEVNGKTVEDLPRMRVRTPGGIFFGKVIARDEDRVTLLTEDGGRITLVSRDVEPAPLGDTRVIGRLEKP